MNVRRAKEAVQGRFRKFAEKYIIGMDFSPELVNALKMNTAINNEWTGGLYQANSLESPVTWDAELFDRNIMGRVDLLFTNLPFGSKISITDTAILARECLGRVINRETPVMAG